MKKDYSHLVGQQFNSFVFVTDDGPAGKYRYGTFKCICGASKRLRIHSVIDGNTKSCGCHKSAVTKKIFTTHGMTGTPEYATWTEMRRRCLNPNNQSFKRYGGRGIVICGEWIDSPETFLRDMGPKPSPEHSIDRIDNNGPYSKDNCRWATSAEQGSNRRSTHYITYQGRTQCRKAWAAALGVSSYMIASRLAKGMSEEEVIGAYL